LLLRKTELAAQLREFAPQYTEKNPKVLQAKTQLSEIDRQLAALGEKNPMGLAAYETLTLERELVRLQTELELARRESGRKKAELDALAAPMVSPLQTDPAIDPICGELRSTWDAIPVPARTARRDTKIKASQRPGNPRSLLLSILQTFLSNLWGRTG
jgi:hypothetical protein